MARQKGHQKGAQRHAEGAHGRKTHGAFIDQIQQPPNAEPQADGAPIEGHHRLHQDRQQHDEAEKNSEKVEAMREVRRGNVDENVLSHARIPHESDSH